MHTIRLKISDKLYKTVLEYFGNFMEEDVQVIEENESFVSIRDYLKKELSKVEEYSSEYLTLKQLDQKLEATIRSHEG